MTKELSTKISNAGLVCACLVVLLHSPIGTRPQSFLWWCDKMGPDGIGYVAVPMFFVISGWFLAGHIGESGWWRREVCKRVASLLVPMFVWCGLWYVCELALGLKSFTFSSLVSAIGLNPFSGLEIGPLWYVRQLFIMVALSPILIRMANVPSLLVLMILNILWIVFGGNHDINYLIRTEGVVAFVFGLFLRKDNIRLDISVRHGALFFIAALCLLVLRNLSVGNGQVYWFVNEVAIVALVPGVWAFIPSRPVFGGLVRFSFPIYVLHMVVYEAFEVMVPGGSLLRFAVMTVCAFVLPCVIAAVSQAYVPALGGLLFGGRCVRRKIK